MGVVFVLKYKTPGLLVNFYRNLRCFQGCSAPLVVKFADTQKDKDVKAKGSVSPVVTGLNNANILQQVGVDYCSFYWLFYSIENLDN